MDNKEYNKLQVKYGLLDSSTVRLIDFLKAQYKLDDEVTKLISIIFSYQYLGHCYTPLKDLKNNYNEILAKRKLLEKEEANNEDIDAEFNKLEEITDSFEKSIDNFKTHTEFIGLNKIFVIDKESNVFINKYYYASLGIKKSFERLFVKTNFSNNILFDEKFITYKLSSQQEEAIQKGLKGNLLITGGPGTGKTTTIMFLLMNLLKDKSENELGKVKIYLTAPSGKAAVRMKESITKGLDKINEKFKESHKTLVKKIESVNGVTIDKLLGYTTDGYRYNIEKQISPEYENIFIIDEASMIDILKFNSLLNAIPNDSRVFILGDKDQLPSVENGAVFNDLLKTDKDCKVEFKESYRFDKNTDVYKLSKYINCDSDNYSFNFQKIDDFKIDNLNKCEVKCFEDSNCGKEGLKKVIKIWWENFFKGIQDIKLDVNELKGEDFDFAKLNTLNNFLEKAKIFSANNNGTRGVNTINKYIKEELCNVKNKNYYHGQILMITQNNSELDLYNGDNGVCVEINNSFYFMIKKSYDNIREGYKEIGIFKIKDFVFYPLELIDSKEITMSYAITIHKSQGSEYDNVLILLPEDKNNPLLTRQIVYTAITRTKEGGCYIISREEILNIARDREEIRLTKILKI